MSLLSITSFQNNAFAKMVNNNVAERVYDSLSVPVTFLDTVMHCDSVPLAFFDSTMELDESLNFFREKFKKLEQKKRCDILHTGYFGSGRQIQLVANLLHDGKINPQLVIVDPLTRNQGGKNIRQDVVDAYPQLICMADIITPSLFELEMLSRRKIQTERDVISAIISVFKIYNNLQAVIMTSMNLPNHETMSICLVTYIKHAVKVDTLHLTNHGFEGTSDMIISLCCSYYAMGESLKNSVNSALSEGCNIIARYKQKERGKKTIARHISKTLPTHNDENNIPIVGIGV